MFTYIKELFIDKTVFIGFSRGILIAAGMAAATQPKSVGEWIGCGLTGLGGFMRSSSHESVPVNPPK